MSEESEDVSAHEVARNLSHIMSTLRAGVQSGEFKAILGTTPDKEPIFVFEWPNCPVYGTATAYFGPQDMENYAHNAHPWEHMRASCAAESPITYEDVVLTSEGVSNAMNALSQGKVICPVTGSDQARIYDHMFCVSASAAAKFKILLCTQDTRWAVSFEMSASTKVSITDAQRRIPKTAAA